MSRLVGYGVSQVPINGMLGGMAYQDPINVTVNNISIGGGALTGTASQLLQVTGGAYVSGNLGIGITNPIGLTTGSAQTLHLNGTSAVLRVGPYYSDVDRDNILLVANSTDSYIRSNNERFHIYNNSGDIVFHGSSDVENARITADGNFTATGTVSSQSLNVGYKRTVAVTGSFAANTWYNTGIDRTLDTGIYLVDAYLETYATGQTYQMSYIGWFVMPNRSSNSGDATTITLHRAGHAPNAETLQMRTLLTPAPGGIIYLQWLSNFAYTLDNTSGKILQVSIHRFATALNNG